MHSQSTSLPVNEHSFTLGARLPAPHLQETYNSWHNLRALLHQGNLVLNGHSLDIASVVALSRHGCVPAIEQSKTVTNGMDDSQEILHKALSESHQVYGVNTGVGGNADLRTNALDNLQQALVQHQQSGILTGVIPSKDAECTAALGSNAMPLSWTKATMLIRCNSNIRGHSGLSRPVIDIIIEMLRRNITPIVPLRGSVSASGDLMPMSYIAGAIQGCPDILVSTVSLQGRREILNSHEALNSTGIAPITLGPKEALSLMNGTAASTAVASLVIYDAQRLAVLSQLLTALTSEALAANVEWALPFVGEIRPHPGQIEVAQNIRTFLSGSKLTRGLGKTEQRYGDGLIQDRYALRSSPQWIGPQLEDLTLAASQIRIELNSTTDNPVINVAQKAIHSGANFQATSITSATEKTRQCLQMFGRMLLSQTTEMINHDFSNGLPTNLAADDPSSSFTLKGVDISMAAYQSELGYLTNSISSHVLSTELHNQSINSLALVSARYTTTAVEIFSSMAACSLYTACQGADLRVMHQTFLEQFEGTALEMFTTALVEIIPHPIMDGMFPLFWTSLCRRWYETAALDAHERCEQATLTLIITLAQTPGLPPTLLLEEIYKLQKRLAADMLKAYLVHRDCYFSQPTTTDYLGYGTKTLYHFVRQKLGVPMHQGLAENPHPGAGGTTLDGRPKRTIGSWISMIYEAICDGRIHDEIMQCVETCGQVDLPVYTKTE